VIEFTSTKPRIIPVSNPSGKQKRRISFFLCNLPRLTVPTCRHFDSFCQVCQQVNLRVLSDAENACFSPGNGAEFRSKIPAFGTAIALIYASEKKVAQTTDFKIRINTVIFRHGFTRINTVLNLVLKANQTSDTRLRRPDLRHPTVIQITGMEKTAAYNSLITIH
jgi:hypothetical protein